MKRSAVENNPGNVDVGSLTSQVSTIWLLSSNTGSYAGSLSGAAAFDTFGFSYGTAIESLVLLITIVMLSLYAVIVMIIGKIKSSKVTQGEQLPFRNRVQ